MTDIHRFKDIHTHGETGEDIITSIEPRQADTMLPYGEAWYSVGIHPWSTAEGYNNADLQYLDHIAEDPRVIAIGEAGLDACRGADLDTQEKVFLHHAELAERLSKPLIIHCVRRFGRIMELHKALKPRQLWIIHGFRGKAELARQLTTQGIGISMGKNAPSGIEHQIPAKLLFRESDGK